MSEKRHYIYQDRYFWSNADDEAFRKSIREELMDGLDIAEDDLVGDSFKAIAMRKEFERLAEQEYTDAEGRNWDDEKGNLGSLEGRGQGYIIAIGDCGYWDRRCDGVKEVGYDVSDIMNSSYGCDYVELFVDESSFDSNDVQFRGVHHDGTHKVVFRALKDDTMRDGTEDYDMYDALSAGREKFYEWVRENTTSIAPLVAEVYGWDLAEKKVA